LKNPAIVIVAYNREKPFIRLLKSLGKAIYYDFDVPLIISIDKGGSERIINISENYVWEHGTKKIIRHTQHLGLKDHLISCGDLSKEYGHVIILEDDLMVSQFFYDYAVKSINWFDTASIMGISLYSPRHNIYTNYPFIPIEDGFDNFYIQMPQTWGQIWGKETWSSFKKWFENEEYLRKLDKSYPIFIDKWSDKSYAKYIWQYMVEEDLYFVIPRTSFTTQFGEFGTNFNQAVTHFQRPLSIGTQEFKFSTFEKSNSKYDSHYELFPEIISKFNDEFEERSFIMDINGSKIINPNEDRYIVTTKPMKRPLREYALQMKPPELNIINKIEGEGINYGTSYEITKVRQFRKKIHNFSWDDYYFRKLTSKRLLGLILRKLF